MDKFERFIAIADRRYIGGLVALDHDHLDTELARRRDLAIGRGAATVLGDDEVDAMLLEQVDLVRFRERTAGKNCGDVGQGERRRYRVDAANDVLVMRGLLEVERLLPADRQENATRRPTERGHGLGHALDARPAVSAFKFPGGTAERKNRRSGCFRRRGGIVRNTGCEGMRRIDQQRDVLRLQEGGKPFCAPETADAGRQQLRARVGGAACERDGGIVARIGRKTLGKLPRLGRAAEDQNARSVHG